jgi:hypothetical protein
VKHAGAFMEFVPLLERAGEAATNGFMASVDPPAIARRNETNIDIGRRKLGVMLVKTKDALTYRLRFAK